MPKTSFKSRALQTSRLLFSPQTICGGGFPPFHCERNLQNRFPEKLRFRNFSAYNSGARNNCANLMGAWHFWLFLLENPDAHKIPPFRWGAGGWGFLEGGGGSANLYFYGRRDFSELCPQLIKHRQASP